VLAFFLRAGRFLGVALAAVFFLAEVFFLAAVFLLAAFLRAGARLAAFFLAGALRAAVFLDAFLLRVAMIAFLHKNKREKFLTSVRVINQKVNHSIFFSIKVLAYTRLLFQKTE